MEQRNLGKSGLQVSTIGIGCNNFGWWIDFEASRSVINEALAAGITFFDTSDSYGEDGASEKILGEVLGSRRKNIVLATKFGSQIDREGRRKGASRRYIIEAVEASLRRLKTDWIDLYQLHRPDPLTPIEETLRALDDLIHQGKVRYIGCSNLAAWQVVESDWIARGNGLNSFICCQDEYSLLNRRIEDSLVPAVKTYGLGLLPYFPLASGLLTGKYQRGMSVAADTRMARVPQLKERFMTEDAWLKLERLSAFCKARNRTLVDLSFSWLLSHAYVASVIAGATTAEQIKQNVVAGSWTLSEADLAEIDAITAA